VPRRVTNDLLLTTLLALALSGLFGWAWPQPSVVPLFQVHRALGLTLLALIGWKTSIVLRSLRRRLGRDRSVVLGIIAGIALLSTVGLGLAWTFNLISFDLLWGYSPMNIHVALGVSLLPFAGWHAWVRRRTNRVSAPVLSRRSALRLGGLAVGTAAGWLAIEQLAPVLNATRLASGSKQTTSLSGNDYPAEIWLLDAVPALNAATWRVRLVGAGLRTAELSLDDLSHYTFRSVQAILDCTSGWWTEQVWSGVSLLDVLRAHGLTEAAREVSLTSVTGHRIALPLTDLGDALLATHVGGEALSPGHGYPVRLVAPGRRGYQWVKWVADIAVS
jgi:DMSO/TMAO reductase YedYZ molybdopterin-dependent catalytic subunit